MANCPKCGMYNHNTEPVYYYECEKKQMSSGSDKPVVVKDYKKIAKSLFDPLQWALIERSLKCDYIIAEALERYEALNAALLADKEAGDAGA